MKRLWHSIWPKNVPKTVNIYNKPLYSVIDDNYRLFPENKALSYEGKSFTYRDLWELSNGAANFLREIGVKYSDKIAIVMFNSVEQLVYLFGALKLGAVVALIDPLTISEDLRFQLEMSTPKIIIADEEVYTREEKTLKSLKESEVLMPKLKRRGEIEEVFINPSKDPAIMIHYAGVAERTLGILHTHAGILTCCNAVKEFLKLPINTKTLVFMPLSHLFGLLMTIQTLFVSGCVLLMKRWDLKKVSKHIEARSVDLLPGPPMVFSELLSKIDKRILRNLKICLTGGAYVPPELQRAFFEDIGVPLIQLYGLSEGLLITMQHPTLKEYGSIGIPLPSVDVKVVNPKTMEELKVNETGELIVKSPWVMKGYIEVEENKRAFIDGWMKTGDLVSMNDKGMLFFKGVRKRFIKYKAYPIFPRDLEIILMRHPAVEYARVIGEDSPDVGQIPVAYVKLKEGYRGKVSENDIMDYINVRVAFYKKIRKVYFIK